MAQTVFNSFQLRTFFCKINEEEILRRSIKHGLNILENVKPMCKSAYQSGVPLQFLFKKCRFVLFANGHLPNKNLYLKLNDKSRLFSKSFALSFQNLFRSPNFNNNALKHNSNKCIKSSSYSQRTIPPKKTFGVCLAAAILTTQITEEEMKRPVNEILEAQKNRRQKMDHKVLAARLQSEGWVALIKEKSFYVFSKVNSLGLKEYKVFGTFMDIPPRIFYDVQLDTEYRKKWDKLVVKLEIIDKAPDGTEVLHWVMDYPYPFFKREYIFQRKAKVDPENNVMVLVNKAMDHPKPVDKSYVRVKRYFSQMVIRPHQGLDDMGLDYILTYYDDPEMSIPTLAFNMMATSGVPEFVVKLHKAALDLYVSKKPQVQPSSLTSSPSEQYAYAYN